MRKQFVECKTRYLAKKQCPWSSKIMKVVDGYLCFESVYDYYVATKQK